MKRKPKKTTRQPRPPRATSARQLTGKRAANSNPQRTAQPVPSQHMRHWQQEIKTYQHQLGLIRNTSLQLTTELSLERALQAIVTTAADFFSADAVSIYLWDEMHTHWTLRAGYGLKTDYLKTQHLPLEKVMTLIESINGYCYTENLSLLSPGETNLLEPENLVSVLTVVLRFANQVLGAINIYSRHRVRHFTQEEIENARLFAQQAAIVVRNAQLYSELHEEAQIAKTLLQIAEDIGTLDSLDQILNRIVTIINRTLKFKLCAIFLWAEDKKLYLPVKAVGLPPHRSPFFSTLILSREDLPFTEQELKQKDVIFFQKTPRRFPEEKLANVFLERDICLVPLVTKGKLMGVIASAGYQREGLLPAKDELFLRGIAAQAAIAIDDANLFEALEGAFWDIIRSLATTIEVKDRYTHSHSQSVSLYGCALTRALHLSAKDEELVNQACLLHDLGKIGIEDGILKKETPLSSQERKAIEEHPIIGADILASIHSLADVAKIIRHHHEYYDGHGYPDHLQGEEIPLHSRILQIADCFDAMTSNRPYRAALSREEAIAELQRNSGKQFDPKLVEVFIQILENKNQEINLQELRQKKTVEGREKSISWY